MTCNCDALQVELMSQRELMAEWFQTLLVEIRDAKAELVELIKANTFKVEEQRITTDQPLTGQQSSIAEAISASEFLESINSPLQYNNSDLNPVSQSQEPFQNPETDQAPEAIFENELISPKIEPTTEELSLEFSASQNTALDEQAKATLELNRLCSVVSPKNQTIQTVPAKNLFSFDQCEHRCATKGNLTTHKRSRTDEKLFRCHLCQKQFKQEHRLTVHMLVHNHNRANPFKCELCNFRCSKTIDLTRHIGLRHIERGQLFACNKCSFTAHSRYELKVHKRVHTVEKPFACAQCDFRTSQKGHLNQHHRIHTGEKPFACNQCDFRTSQKGNLKYHQRVHTGQKPFACDQCDFRALRKDDLNKHHRIHTGEKPFACDQCDFRASRKDGLNIHHRIHTGEKPFQCDLCDYRAVSGSTLVRHRKSKHLPQK